MLSVEERAALATELGLSRSAANGAGKSERAAGSERLDDALMEPFGIRLRAETVAALMIQATQRADVPLLADILSLMFGGYSRDRVERVQSVADRLGLAR